MNEKQTSRYRSGVLLIVVSAITFSSAGLFTKGVETGAWEVIYWRGVFAAAFTCAWIVYKKSLRHNFVEMGISGWVIAVIGAAGTAAFIQSFKLTSIANVSLIYAVSPLIAALLAWCVMGEKVSSRTMLGCVGALAGVAIIVSGSLGLSQGHSEGDSQGQVSVYGDLLALFMTTVMASIMVIYRKFPGTPGAGPAVMSSLLLLPVALSLGNPFAVAGTEVSVLAAFGLLFALASVTLAEGAKRVPSGKTALLSSLETPLAPLFAFLLLSEVPVPATFVGGSIVLIAVLLPITEGKPES